MALACVASVSAGFGSKELQGDKWSDSFVPLYAGYYGSGIKTDLAPVVQKADSAIHRINHYPADSVVCFVNTYPLDSDLSGG